MKNGSAAREALGPSFYDAAFRKDPLYRGDWQRSPYVQVWRRIADLVPDGARVLEVGCGPGQLARCLHDLCELGAYHGFDFSPVAVDRARESSPEVSFSVDDARAEASYDRDFDVLVVTEVLEHLEDDFGVLRCAASKAPGALCLFTVPNRNSKGHVRYFPRVEGVRARYEGYFETLELETFKGPGQWLYYLGVGRLLLPEPSAESSGK